MGLGRFVLGRYPFFSDPAVPLSLSFVCRTHHGLREARKQGVTQRLLIGGDSELVIKQMTGEYTTRSPVLQILRHIALGEVARYPSPPEFVAIPREENTEADALATAGSNKALEYKSPDRNVAVYRPNLGCFSYVKIDGVRAVGTNDIRVMNVFHAAMIDAAFLYSLPNGTEYLRNLKPFENISMVTTKGVHLPVLGCVQLAANVEFCASPRQPRRSLEKRVVDRYLVVLDLPVPVHVHHDERRDGFQTSDSDLGGIEKNLDLLPTRYRDHQLYSPELANVVQLGF